LAFIILLNQVFKSQLLPVEEYNTTNFPPSNAKFFYLYISPDNIQTQLIARGISSRFIWKTVFGTNIEDLRQKYLNDFKNETTSFGFNAFGVAFSESPNLFPFEYTLLTQYDSKFLTSNNKKINYFTDTRSCRNETGASTYDNCGGNQFAYNGLGYLQNSLNNFIRKV
jgi:hypothetical protein